MPRSTRKALSGASPPPVSIWTAAHRADPLAVADDDPAEHVGVAAHPLGQRLDHEVRAELDRPAQVGRGERVVDRRR